VTRADAVRFAVDREHIAAVRHAVAQFAAWHGLADPARADFVLAVNELLTNAVRHGGGSGDVWLWRTRDGLWCDGLWCDGLWCDGLWCEVADRGPGIAQDRLDGHRLPPPQAPGGRGLWLVHQLCDQVTISTGQGGTTVRVVKHLG
jgi:serine/threonine-protein kinase RsbW